MNNYFQSLVCRVKNNELKENQNKLKVFYSFVALGKINETDISVFISDCLWEIIKEIGEIGKSIDLKKSSRECYHYINGKFKTMLIQL